MAMTRSALENLAEEIKSCSRCELRLGATAPVPGLGEQGAKYFILGEGPGKTEDEQNIPFVGSAGKKLNTLLQLAKINPNDCFITNVVKCRPPNNRDPKQKEIKICRRFLDEEIRLVSPSTIITLGAVPLSLFTKVGIKKLHGTLLTVEIPDACGKKKEKSNDVGGSV